MTESQTPAHLTALDRLGLFMVQAGFAASLGVFILALPPFRTGIWFQSEPVTAGFILTAATAALGLLILFLGTNRRAMVTGACLHPFVLAPAAMALWSTATAPFATAPGLSLAGSPEIGQGAAWYANLAVLTAAAMVVFRIRRHRRFFAGLAVFLAFAVTGLTYMAAFPSFPDEVRQWAPYLFFDYLAFYGIFIAVILATWTPHISPGKKMFALSAGFLVLLLSANVSAVAISLAVGGFVFVLSKTQARLPISPRPLFAATTLITPVLVMGSVTLAAYIGGILGISSSFWSRYFLNKIAFDATAANPGGLFLGYGWGHFADLLFTHARQKDVSLASSMMRGTNWDALANTHFHSHNYLVEALLAAGVIGLLIAWIYPMLFVFFSRRKYLFLAGGLGLVMAGVESVWFQFALSVPFQAMALGGLANRWRLPAPPGMARILVLSLLVGTIFLQSFTAWSQLTVAVKMRAAIIYDLAILKSDEAENPQAGKNCRTAFDDYERGGVHLSWALRNFIAILGKNEKKEKPLTTAQIDRLKYYLCAAESYPGEKASIRLLAGALNARGDLAFNFKNPAIKKAARPYLANWQERLNEYLSRAPKRTDMAIGFFTWRLESGDEDVVRKFSDRFLSQNGDDPVALWFSGVVLLKDPATAKEGLVRLQRSLELGIERFLKVKTKLKKEINGGG